MTSHWTFVTRSFVAVSFEGESINPIPSGAGLNQPMYSYHVTQAGRNRVKGISFQGALALRVSPFEGLSC